MTGPRSGFAEEEIEPVSLATRVSVATGVSLASGISLTTVNWNFQKGLERHEERDPYLYDM